MTDDLLTKMATKCGYAKQGMIHIPRQMEQEDTRFICITQNGMQLKTCYY